MFCQAGGGIYNLTFARRELTSTAGVLGGRVAFPMHGWTPRIRGEWRHEFSATGTQYLGTPNNPGVIGPKVIHCA